MQTLASNPRRPVFWIRIGLLILALAAVVYFMGYFQSGKFEQSPAVKSFMEQPGPESHPAKVILDQVPGQGHPAPTSSPASH